MCARDNQFQLITHSPQLSSRNNAIRHTRTRAQHIRRTDAVIREYLTASRGPLSRAGGNNNYRVCPPGHRVSIGSGRFARSCTPSVGIVSDERIVVYTCVSVWICLACVSPIRKTRGRVFISILFCVRACVECVRACASASQRKQPTSEYYSRMSKFKRFRWGR